MDLRFDGADLDTTVWVPRYLPAWSSRTASVASYRLENHASPRWAHPRPAAVRQGQTVREEQPRLEVPIIAR